MNNNIEQLVSVLPEKYQPIFGHPEISNEASRACDDRLAVIRETHDALQTLIGRPLRVLDLGCAQGYFSLSLAAAGADVVGIDYLPANVAVCEALASQRPELKARFQVGRIEDAIENLQPDEFDLVLGLSVFHHVIHEKGILAVKNLLNTAAERVGCLLLELALKSEPLYWGPSQPDAPRELLVDMAFAHQLALHPTHLADIPRPMFAASNRIWVLNGQAQKILDWTAEPHQLAAGTHHGTRRYYWSENYFAKLSRIDNERGAHNLSEYGREIEFLKNVPNGFKAPSLNCYGQNESETWCVQNRLRGKLLSELLIDGAEIKNKLVLQDVIGQVCELEAAGWYHSDIRTWNTLIQEDGSAILIDYGSMLRKPRDCVWPNNIFLAFLTFVYEVATRHIESPVPLRAVAMSPGRFPAPYDTLVRRLWSVPVAQWSFSLFKTFFDEMELTVEANVQPNEAWSTAIESAIQALSCGQHVITQKLESKARPSEALAQQALAQAYQALSNTQQELQSARDEAEQASTENMHARQLLEQTLAQAEEQVAVLGLELGEVKRNSEMMEGECEEAWREFAGARERGGHLEVQLKALNLQLDGLTQELNAVHQHKHQIYEDLQSSEAHKHSLHASLVGLEERVLAIQNQLNESLGSAHHWWLQAIAHEQRIKALLNSTSWRITWPLRTLSRAVRWTARLPFRLAKSLARPALNRAMGLVLGRPALRVKLARLLQRHPKLHQHLRAFAKRRNLISGFPPSDTTLISPKGYSRQEQVTSNYPDDAPKGPYLSALSVDARRYFHQLNNAIEQQKSGSL